MIISLPLVGIFTLSAVICFAAAARGSRLSNPASRRGLRWLLVVVGLWGISQAGLLLVSTESAANVLFIISLVIGFATIGPWLYFCSAYAGYEYHTRRPYRLAAVTTYLVVVTAKVTNPIHGYYFDLVLRAEPTRLLIDQRPLYWGSFLLAYALTGIGFVLLYRLFRESHRSPWPLLALFAVTGAASVPKMISLFSPGLAPVLTYEPVGVAVFAVGTSVFVEDQFLREERATRRSVVNRAAGGILVVNADGLVTEYNDRAVELFPTLDTSAPLTIDEVSPSIAAEYDTGRSTLIERGNKETTQTYLITSHPLEIGTETFGHTLLIQDVTTLEQQRERRKRHEQQLADMSGAIAHELRNSVTIANGYLQVATDQLDADETAAARTSLETAHNRVKRIEESTEDLHTLVRYTQDAGEQQFVDIETILTEAATTITDAPKAIVSGAGELYAAPTRLKHLLQNAVRFAAYNGATTVVIRVRASGFDVTDDGRHDTEGCGDDLFAYDGAEPTADAGMALPNVRALARTEGWSVEPDPTYTDGVRYCVRDAKVRRLNERPPTERTDEPGSSASAALGPSVSFESQFDSS